MHLVANALHLNLTLHVHVIARRISLLSYSNAKLVYNSYFKDDITFISRVTGLLSVTGETVAT